MNELEESSAQKAQAEADRAVLEKRKQKEILKMEIEEAVKKKEREKVKIEVKRLKKEKRLRN
jgi:hypothetical protein